MLPEASEDLSDDLSVSSEVRVGGEDVVEVDHDVSRQDEVLENVVHHGLEGRRGVGKAEIYYQRLEESAVSTEHGLPLVALADADIVESPPDIELREESGPFQTINKVVNERNGVPVLYGHCVQCPVVLDEPELPVLLLYEEDRRSHW